jgi:hypothetical protein
MDFDMKLSSAKTSTTIQDEEDEEPLSSPEGWNYNDVIYTAEPIAFIQSAANGKLVINPKARDMLSRIEKPLVVISIAGLYRTGIYGNSPLSDKEKLKI